MKTYVVDSNFFIQAHRAYYPLDVAVSFWRKVNQLAIAGKIISIDKVKDELYNKNDELESWCRTYLPDDFFKDTTDVMPAYSRVVSWASVQRSRFQQKALDEFLSADEADAFLIAYALTDNMQRIIVTQEISQPERRNKIKIPEPSNELGVGYVDTMSMFRQLGESF